MSSVPSQSLSYLDLINRCDNTTINHSAPGDFSDALFEELTPLRLSADPDSPVIGLLRPIMIQQLSADNERSIKEGKKELWFLDPKLHNGFASLQAWLNTPSKRTTALKELSERWRDEEVFPDVSGKRKWRNEMYPVYKDPFGVHDYPSDAGRDDYNYAFEIERSVCALFGIVTYGVHMTIYQESIATRSLKIWVPTRARTKQTFPGMLDNTVAGGIPSGMGMFDSLVKECMEEASIEEHVVNAHARGAGVISYFYKTTAGWLQPEIEYVYDMPMPLNADPVPFTPKPLDGEVESFDFLTQDQVISKMRAGLFKPNCALVLIDLFVRLGYISPENEPDYMKIVTRLHGRFDYDLWQAQAQA
ncbi:nudix hydrolase 20 [Dendrothele bispora CBS 962.96]|uniref:Nudix hydrolase 20 n=1 Tax=Dendrothele bispora (strain CBS 962.96) TaxID=1314807 RepID=A0A4V4HHC0_DENBC|nr:nudix hydrolase 20 [Dendrothele bispora CBS 962.96]